MPARERQGSGSGSLPGRHAYPPSAASHILRWALPLALLSTLLLTNCGTGSEAGSKEQQDAARLIHLLEIVRTEAPTANLYAQARMTTAADRVREICADEGLADSLASACSRSVIALDTDEASLYADAHDALLDVVTRTEATRLVADHDLDRDLLDSRPPSPDLLQAVTLVLNHADSWHHNTGPRRERLVEYLDGVERVCTGITDENRLACLAAQIAIDPLRPSMQTEDRAIYRAGREAALPLLRAFVRIP